MHRINFCKILVILTLLFSNIVFAAQSKILIVNSDNNIHRYNKIATEFKSILQKNNHVWDEIDLGNLSNPESTLKQTIQQQHPDIIYSIGSKSYSLASKYTNNIKLLFSGIINWHRLDVEHNIYGVANELNPSQDISLIRYFFPKVKSLGLLYNKQYSAEYVESIKSKAVSLGVKIITQQLDKVEEIPTKLNNLLSQVDMFWLISDPILVNSKQSVQQIFSAAKQHQKPVYVYNDVFIKYGGLLAISADFGTVGRQAANLFMIMEKNKSKNGMVQIPAGSSISLNMCEIEALQIEFNQEALDSVNKIINCPDIQ